MWSSILPSWYSYCSWIWRRGGQLKLIWVIRTSENSARLQMLRCNKGDKSAFNSMYIFCWSNLGCYYSSLISSRWQEHQIYTRELLNTSFSNFFSVFSNITYLIFHSYFKDICAVFTYKGLTLFLVCWVSQKEWKITSLITAATMALWIT